MSEVSDAAIVSILLADYAAADAAGKLNVIGGGITIIGLTSTGTTSPFSVVVTITVPPQLYNAECAVELQLEDSAGEIVALPGPAEPQLMRIGQSIAFDEPTHKGAPVPRRTLRSRQQFVLNFAAGLPLTLGLKYTWRVKIDATSRDSWTEEFFVPGPVPGPVLG